jgi:ankyrin repeat protein
VTPDPTPDPTPDLTPDELALLQSAFELARDGDLARLSELWDLGVPVNLTNGSGDTLLLLAAYHVHADVVRALLARGADHARVNDKGQTALAAAVFRQDHGIVGELLAAGADPDLGPKSAVTIATFFDLPEMLALLRP